MVLCAGLLSPWRLLISDVKCIKRSTWYLLAHLYGIGTTPCSCLGIEELPQVEGVAALQSQAAPWSREPQSCFSSATFVLPLLGRGWHMLQALSCQSSFTRETRETAIMVHRENYFPACRLTFNWSDFSHPFLFHELLSILNLHFKFPFNLFDWQRRRMRDGVENNLTQHFFLLCGRLGFT